MKLLTVKETSEILNVSPARVYDLVQQGALPVVRVFRQVRIDMDRLAQWIADGGLMLPRSDIQTNAADDE